MVIDAHHHFWNYNPAEYAWIDESMSKLRRDFLPGDLQHALREAAVDGVISVQARQSIAETQWLLELAKENAFIRGVVGWVPLVSESVASDLEKFADNPSLRAVRHVVQGEPDDNFILRDDFNRGVARLAHLGLRYDILIFEKHLPQTIQFVDRHPSQIFILDHLAKPRIKAREMEPWSRNMCELSQRPNVYCKVSGMVTEADWTKWKPADLRRYFDVALDAFGPRRLMFGSDWPVCLLATSYGGWRKLVNDWAAELSPAEQARLFGATAMEAYGIG